MGADPELVLQRGGPDMQGGPISFMLLFEAPKSIDDKRLKKYLHAEKGRGSFLFASLFLFPKKYLPSLQAIVRVWTHMIIDLRWVCTYSTDFEGKLWFKSSPYPVAWWEGVEKGTNWYGNGGRVAWEQLSLACKKMGFEDTVATPGKERSSQCSGSGLSCLLHLGVSQVSISLKLTWFSELVVGLPVEGCAAVQFSSG